MSQQAMRITVDAAMRARDVSRPRAEGDETARPPAAPPKPREMSKGERRRLDRRAAKRR